MGFKISLEAGQELETLVTAEMFKLSFSREAILQDDLVMSELILESAVGDFKRDISGSVTVFDNNALEEPQLSKLRNLREWKPFNPNPDHVLDECYEDRLVRYRLKPNVSKRATSAGGGSVAKPRNRTSFPATPLSQNSSDSNCSSSNSSSGGFIPLFEVNRNDPEICHIEDAFKKQIEELQNAYRAHISLHITQRERHAQAKRVEEEAEQQRFQTYMAAYKSAESIDTQSLTTDVPGVTSVTPTGTNSDDVIVLSGPVINDISNDAHANSAGESVQTLKKGKR